MMKVFNESGKGYWMEGFGCIRAEGENRPSRPGHIVCFRKSTMTGKGKGVDVWVEDEITNTLNGYEFHSQVRTPKIVCYAPDGNHCGAYLESKTSATLQTRYHYGSGGDAVLIMEKRDKDMRCAAFMGGQAPDVVYEVKDG